MSLYGGDEPAPSLPMGRVTLLLSDIEGSTRLWEIDEDAAAAAIARHYVLLHEAISGHGGVRPLEQGEGDSVVDAFAVASDAVAAALEAQLAFAAEAWPTERDVKVRIALHSGEARRRDEENYCGPVIIPLRPLLSVGGLTDDHTPSNLKDGGGRLGPIGPDQVDHRAVWCLDQQFRCRGGSS
jgi:hypothetical protein